MREDARQASHQPRRAAGASAADRDDRRCRGQGLPVLRRRPASDRRGCQREARHRSRAVPGAGRAAAQIRLPRLRGRGRPGAGAGATDRGRPPDRGDWSPTCWSPSTPTTCRSIVRRRSTSARASISIARRSPTGSAVRPSFCGRFTSAFSRIFESSTKLFADETTAPVLDPGRGRTKTGQLWAYASDDRPWGGSDPPAVAYVYAPDRKASQPIAHLAGFKGVLQVDGYAGYRALAERATLALAFCWSHVRRRFYDRAVAEAHHRQPERQERGKGGPEIDPAGYDAGKKIKGKPARSRRYPRPADARDRARRRHPGSRRRRAGDGEPVRRLSVPA